MRLPNAACGQRLKWRDSDRIVTPNAICDGVAPFSITQQEATVTSTQLSGRTLAGGNLKVLRYRLDDLGWFQFESLVQSLLKAELGLGVESWGGPGDQGRDSYFDGALRYPAKNKEDGPFLFQIKFVQAANAAGARPTGSLLKAVRSECRRIRSRTSSGFWRVPRHYILVTNAPLTAALRTTIRDTLVSGSEAMHVHVLGGADVCDMLDRQPSLRQAFPQILSIRDLNHLLSHAVNKDVLERSRLACRSAADLVPIFIPTSAYRRAWRVLQRHHFAVLEGPPEMGKTAIAWMICLIQVLKEWDAIVCDRPQHFLRAIEHDRHQIFIADDAFGRTEYDPSRGTYWEHDLDRVLQAVDRQHWLIWTSRKHILERALRRLDLQGRAERFPNPGSVLVDAGQLGTEEKALILYRHAKYAHLRRSDVAIVKENAPLIVNHGSFTPERIRRFVIERLPALGDALRRGDRAAIREEVAEAISNPTIRMRKAFAALPESHKWVLISMLECESWPQESEVELTYRAHGPDSVRINFGDVVEELVESFVKRRKSRTSYILEWVHPSYRDLVIEELSKDAALRERFLSTCSIAGLKLAISQVGGAAGTRRFPLMVGEEAWKTLKERAAVLIKDATVEAGCEVLTAISDAIESTEDEESKAGMLALLATSCDVARETWDAERRVLSGPEVVAYGSASARLVELPRMPQIATSWDDGEARLQGVLDREVGEVLEAGQLMDWIELVDAVRRTEPRFVEKRGFPEQYGEEIDAVLEEMEEEWRTVDDEGEEYVLRSEADRLESMATVAEGLAKFPGEHVTLAIDLKNRLRNKVVDLREKAAEMEEPEEDYDNERGRVIGFNIEALFSDL